jgi:hypothetical protein
LESLRESPELRERGLLGRCLYVVPPQRAGWRDVAPNVVAAHYERVVSTYALRVTRLLDLRLETQANVSFASEARVLVEAYSRNVEPRLRPGGDLADLGGWGGRLPGLLVRFATLLYVAGEDDPTSALARPLPASAVEAAIPLADWATGNALVAFDVMATAGGIVDARYLLAAIRRRGVDTVTRRDLHHWTEHRFPRAEDLDDGIGVLVERGYLRERASAEARTRGRPASPTYDVRPTEPTQMPPAPNSVVSVGKVDPYDAAEREAIAATDAPDTIRALAPAFDEWVVKLGRKATDAEQLGARLRNAPPPRPLAELRERDPSAFDRAARESVERWSRSRGATP